ncbi:hypothetical protein J5N97_027952 [Dioscorea zingiberensis]|uniref:Uncharacterized protein n=1 Tax=Dioscorea zingiberensis TaxID=325984 RepID=A0A9D5BY75_9LILI|nr:hypothetical protein J5N97_027952 [Dioscorea zingiberensis]
MLVDRERGGAGGRSSQGRPTWRCSPSSGAAARRNGGLRAERSYERCCCEAARRERAETGRAWRAAVHQGAAQELEWYAGGARRGGRSRPTELVARLGLVSGRREKGGRRMGAGAGKFGGAAAQGGGGGALAAG